MTLDTMWSVYRMELSYVLTYCFSLSVRHGFVGISSVEENTPNSGGYRNAYVRWEPIK